MGTVGMVGTTPGAPMSQNAAVERHGACAGPVVHTGASRKIRLLCAFCNGDCVCVTTGTQSRLEPDNGLPTPSDRNDTDRPLTAVRPLGFRFWKGEIHVPARDVDHRGD